MKKFLILLSLVAISLSSFSQKEELDMLAEKFANEFYKSIEGTVKDGEKVAICFVQRSEGKVSQLGVNISNNLNQYISEHKKNAGKYTFLGAENYDSYIDLVCTDTTNCLPLTKDENKEYYEELYKYNKPDYYLIGKYELGTNKIILTDFTLLPNKYMTPGEEPIYIKEVEISISIGSIKKEDNASPKNVDVKSFAKIEERGLYLTIFDYEDPTKNITDRVICQVLGYRYKLESGTTEMIIPLTNLEKNSKIVTAIIESPGYDIQTVTINIIDSITNVPPIYMKKKCGNNKFERQPQITVKVTNQITKETIGTADIVMRYKDVENNGQRLVKKVLPGVIYQLTTEANGVVSRELKFEKKEFFVTASKAGFKECENNIPVKLDCHTKILDTIKLELVPEFFQIDKAIICDAQTKKKIRSVNAKIFAAGENIEVKDGTLTASIKYERIRDSNFVAKILFWTSEAIIAKNKNNPFYKIIIPIDFNKNYIYSDTIFVEPATVKVIAHFVDAYNPSVPINKEIKVKITRIANSTVTETYEKNYDTTVTIKNGKLELNVPSRFEHIDLIYENTIKVGSIKEEKFYADLSTNTDRIFYIHYSTKAPTFPDNDFKNYFAKYNLYLEKTDLCITDIKKWQDELKVVQTENDKYYKEGILCTYPSVYYYLKGVENIINYKIYGDRFMQEGKVSDKTQAIKYHTAAVDNFKKSIYSYDSDNKGEYNKYPNDTQDWITGLITIKEKEYKGCNDCKNSLYAELAIIKYNCTDLTNPIITKAIELITIDKLFDFGCELNTYSNDKLKLIYPTLCGWLLKINTYDEKTKRSAYLCAGMLNFQKFKHEERKQYIDSSLKYYKLFIASSEDNAIKERATDWVKMLEERKFVGCMNCKSEFFIPTATSDKCDDITPYTISKINTETIIKNLPAHLKEKYGVDKLKNIEITITRDGNDLKIIIIDKSLTYDLGIYGSEMMEHVMKTTLEVVFREGSIIPTPHTKINGYIIGEADGSPIKGGIFRKDSYGSIANHANYNFASYESTVNDSLISSKPASLVSLAATGKIMSNGELAFMRAYAIYNVLKEFGTLSVGDNIKLFSKANMKKGVEYRKTTTHLTIKEYYNAKPIIKPLPMDEVNKMLIKD